jgi:hypothetical protein
VKNLVLKIEKQPNKRITTQRGMPSNAKKITRRRGEQ